jgi:type II secretory pathway component PulF
MRLAPEEPPSLGSMPAVKKVFAAALDHVDAITCAERIVILFEEGSQAPKVRASKGIAADSFWLVAPLSLSLLKQVQDTGEPLEIMDVPGDARTAGQLSLVLSDVRTLVCTPIWGNKGTVAGLIYVDWVRAIAPLRLRTLPKLQEIALKLESFLRQVESGQALVANPFAEPPVDSVVALGTVSGRLPERAPEVTRSAPPPRPTSGIVAQPASGALVRPSSGALPRTASGALPRPQGSSPIRIGSGPNVGARERVLFLRCLATMFGAGLPLTVALQALAKSSSKVMQTPIAAIECRVQTGQTLSNACAETGIFSEMVVGTIRVGERSGSLHHCLNRLAELEEGSERRRNQLQSALTYPAVVLVLSLLFMAFAPAAMLSAQVKLLANLNIELPLVSKLFLQSYAFVAHPLTVLTVAVGLGLVVSSPKLRRVISVCIKNTALRWRPIQQIWRSYLMAQWCQSMALQLQSGLTVLESLTLAAGTTPSSQLRASCHGMRQELMGGRDFSDCLGTQRFSKLLVEMVRVGEESGQLPTMLTWLSRYFEEDFASTLDGLTELLEPLVMAVLGTLAGVLMLITLLPMVKALQQL